MAEENKTRANSILLYCIILLLLGVGWMTIGSIILDKLVSDSDVKKILNIITIFSLGLGDDIEILSGTIIAIGFVTVSCAVTELVLHCYRRWKGKEDQLSKTKIILICFFFGILIASRIIVFGLWIHINIKIKEVESKKCLLENIEKYFTEDADVVSNLVSFPNSWNKVFMELDCCAVRPVFSTTNDFDKTPWCTTSGECQQTNSQIPKTCCNGVTVSTYSSAPSACHANVESGTYNTKGCYEVLRDEVLCYSYVVIGYFIFEIVAAVVAAVVLVLINIYNNTKISNTNHQQCKVCKKEGHAAGSVNCESYVQQDKNVVVIKKHNVLSNSFTVKIEIDGKIYRSAEQAYQAYEALEKGDIDAMIKTENATDCFQAKRIGDTVKTNSDGEKRKKDIMKRVLQAKFDQIESFQEKVTDFGAKCILVEATDDMFWGSGLNEQETLHTKHNAWPGKNMLGQLIVSLKDRKRRKSSNFTRDFQ